MKIAVTGATGYVGSLLVRVHAARGDEVHALARDPRRLPALPGVSVYSVDVTVPGRTPDALFDGTDVLYHCAAEIAHEPHMRAVNVEATRALLLRARGSIGHWVQLSSLSVYGTPRAGVIGEDSPLRPRSLYARTKLEADELVEQATAGAFTYTLVRPSGVIGPNMRSRAMAGLIDAVAGGRFAFIGPPGAIGNYIHEDNLIEALVLCATRSEARQRTYNVSQNIPIEDMVATIASAVGRAPPRMRMPETLARAIAQLARVAPGFPLTPARVDALTSRVDYRADRIERELGYRARKPIEDALRALVARQRDTR